MRLRRPSLFYPPLFECIERVTACLGRRCVHAPGHVAGRYLWCCGRCLVPGLLCFITAACVGGKCMGFKRKRKRKKTGLPCRCCRSREGEWAPLNLMLLVFSCFLFSTWEGKAVSGNGSWLGLQISGENPFETPSGPMFLLFLNITKKSFQGHLGLVYKKGLPNAGSKHTRYPLQGRGAGSSRTQTPGICIAWGLKRLCSWMCKNVLLRAPRADRYPVPLASNTAWTVKGKRTTTRQVSRRNERQWRCQELRRLQVWWWRYLFTKSFLQPPPDFIDGEFRWAIHHSDKDVFFWVDFVLNLFTHFLVYWTVYICFFY